MAAVSSTLYTNAIIITVDPQRRIFPCGALLVEGDRIAAVGESSSLERSLPSNCTRVNLQRKIVIPGLINGHVHLVQSVMRGIAEDMNLHQWASCSIWPLEVSYVGDDGYVAAKLAMAEMIKTGTTCFLEPMLPSSAQIGRVADAVEEIGIRACLVRIAYILAFE